MIEQVVIRVFRLKLLMGRPPVAVLVTAGMQVIGLADAQNIHHSSAASHSRGARHTPLCPIRLSVMRPFLKTT